MIYAHSTECVTALLADSAATVAEFELYEHIWYCIYDHGLSTNLSQSRHQEEVTKPSLPNTQRATSVTAEQRRLRSAGAI